jgi:hypothetical protein
MSAAEFSWKRGLLHGGLAVLLLILAMVVLIAVRPPADPEKLGEGTGRFAVFLFGAVVGISYLRQTGRRRLAGWLSIGGVALIVAAVAAVAAPGCKGAAKLPDGAKSPLVEEEVDGGKRLRHPVLGFSLRHPGGSYVESPYMAKVMHDSAGNDEAMHYYAYAEPLPQAALVIGLAPGGQSESALEQAVEGLTRGLAELLREQLGGAEVRIVQKEVSWTAEKREANVRIVAAEQIHMRMRALPLASGVLVIVTALGPDIAALEPSIDSLRAD